MVEKILSRQAGQTAYAGEVVTAEVDACMTNDASGPLSIEYLAKMGIKTIRHPERIAFIIDHYVPCPDAKVAGLQQSIYDFTALHGIRVVAGGEGIGHQIFDELGFVRPGALIVGGDSHTTTYGYLNCLAAGMGASDMAMAMSSGRLWFRVPETILVQLSGHPAPGISGKDIALYLLKILGASGANYCAVEFAAAGLAAIDMDDRRVICNMLAESSAKCAIMPFDTTTEAYCREHGIAHDQAILSDPGCTYRQIVEIDLTNLGFQIALPHSPANVTDLREVAGLKIDMALIGTCTNGRLSDFLAAAELLRHCQGVFAIETLLIPGSRRIYLELIQRGIAAELLERGGIILPPACGPCCGSSPGVPRDGFNVLSTANRNYLGRMGNTAAQIYLASPLVVTAAALTGRIIDPNELLTEEV